MNGVTGLSEPQTFSGAQAAATSFGARNPSADLARSELVDRDQGLALRYFPLSPSEDHTVYTTTDHITIDVSVSRVTEGASGAKVEETSQVIDETVTTTDDSLTGTSTSKAVTISQPATSTADATAAQAAKVSGGGTDVDEQVSISDKRTTTKLTYATALSGAPTAPSSTQTISLSTVSNVSQTITKDQSLAFGDSQTAPSATDALNALASTYSDDSTLASLLVGPYAPRFVNVTV